MKASQSKEQFLVLVEIPESVSTINAKTTEVPFTMHLTNSILNYCSFLGFNKNAFVGSRGKRPHSVTENDYINTGVVQLQSIIQQEIANFHYGKLHNGGRLQSPPVYIGNQPFRSYREQQNRFFYVFPNLLLSLFFGFVPLLTTTLRLADEKGKKLWDHICSSTGLSVVTLAYGHLLFCGVHMGLWNSYLGIAFSAVSMNAGGCLRRRLYSSLSPGTSSPASPRLPTVSNFCSFQT